MPSLVRILISGIAFTPALASTADRVAAGEVSFFVQAVEGPSSPAPDPRLAQAFRDSVAADVAEIDFRECGSGPLPGSRLSAGPVRIALTLLDPTGRAVAGAAAAGGPTIETFAGIPHVPGIFGGGPDGAALLNRASANGKSQVVGAAIEFAFSAPVRGFGAWVVQDVSEENGYVLRVTAKDGATAVSPVLDSGNGRGLTPEGFIGATCESGIIKAVVEQRTLDGSPSDRNFFYLDHIQVAMPGSAMSSPAQPLVKRSGGGLTLRVVGSDAAGYGVEILHDGLPVARHAGGGEFSAFFENGERTVAGEVRDWRGAAWKGDEKHVELERQTSQLNATFPQMAVNVEMRVAYDVVHPHVVRKQIFLRQTDAPVVLYRLRNRLEPVGRPDSYWSFEEDHPTGGGLHQVYPAAGFRVGQLGVGLLTDAGHRNLWTRANRRRSPKGWVSLTEVPDPNLIAVATNADREAGRHFVEMNFGELQSPSGMQKAVELPVIPEWKPFQGGVLEPESTPSRFSMRVDSAEAGNRGITIPLRLPGGTQYELTFKYRGDCRHLGIRLWDGKTGRDAGPYDDAITAEKEEWRTYSASFIPAGASAEGSDFNLFLGRGYHETQPCRIQIRDLSLSARPARTLCYHPLRLGETATKTMFIFVEPSTSIGDLRRASQVRLSEGLGFRGSDEEKIFYATSRMLSWIAEPLDLTPLVVPSLSYSPDVYFRDAFWICLSTYDRAVSEAMCAKWGATQAEDGSLDTILTPYFGSLENVDNDSGVYYILWNYVNHKRYRTPIDSERVARALGFLRKIWDPDGDGVIVSRTPCSTDTMWTFDKKVVWADMQGYYPVVLRCAAEMGLSVTEKELSGARSAYRNLYDPGLGHIIYADFPDRRNILCPGVFFGEFLSLWLWNEPILSDEAVVNTLEKLPVSPVCGGIPGWVYYADGKIEYFTKERNPFSVAAGQDIPWKPGVYTNGAAWFYQDYYAYAVGHKHGWKPALERMKQRAAAELGYSRDWPISWEWLPTTEEAARECRPEGLTKVFGWNASMLIANELVGLRRPEWDPDFGR